MKFLSSQLLKPILNKELVIVEFAGNPSIDATYDSNDPEGITLKKLMRLMDQNYAESMMKQKHKNKAFPDEVTTALSEMWATGRLSDFTIVANYTREFRVHKSVLGLNSSVFEEMFNSQKGDNQLRKFKISEFKTESIMQFLEYFYTGAIKEDENVMELFELAATYKVHKLMLMCEEILSSNLNKSNALQVFTLADRFNIQTLKEKAFEGIKQIKLLKNLPTNLLDDSESIKQLVEAASSRKRKIKEARERFDAEIKSAKSDFKEIWKNVTEKE